MDAFMYSDFIKDCTWDVYNKINKLNKDGESKIYPVTGYYIADYEFGENKLNKAVLHPEDAQSEDGYYKKWSELIHSFRDI